MNHVVVKRLGEIRLRQMGCFTWFESNLAKVFWNLLNVSEMRNMILILIPKPTIFNSIVPKFQSQKLVGFMVVGGLDYLYFHVSCVAVNCKTSL